jgi:hypothetical protein
VFINDLHPKKGRILDANPLKSVETQLMRRKNEEEEYETPIKTPLVML